ncbi:oxidoreductase [Actinomadura hibisca]|uniref:oxidoreductase n=1 Tax=Actinomadura hibisca TaxID=68565 RepID=UPI00082EB690|nr:oxidoreductase [Actinomadura hibisca]
MTATPRTWLITGGSSGLGRAVATAALEAGDTVVSADRHPARFADLADAHPGRGSATFLDVTDIGGVPAVVAETVERHGRIDVLVNAAGRGLIGAAEETGDAELRDLMDLHFFGPAELSRAVLPHMRAQGSGTIVQISSMGGRMSFAGVPAYSATKFALEGWSEALAREVETFGIRVLIVEPGAFRTGFAAGGTLRRSTPIPAYAPIVEPVWQANLDSHGGQPGDPAKAAAALLAVLEADRPPLRLPLGNDATDAILANLDDTRQDVLAWEKLSRSTDFA